MYISSQLGIHGSSKVKKEADKSLADKTLKLRDAMTRNDGRGDREDILNLTNQIAAENSRLANHLSKKEGKKAFDKKAMDEYELTGMLCLMLGYQTEF